MEKDKWEVLNRISVAESRLCVVGRTRDWPLACNLTVLTVVLAALSALLVIQKQQLRVEAEELRQTVRRQVDFPHAGMVVPAFDGVTLEGEGVRVGVAAPGTRQVLFILDTRCGN